MNRKSLIEIVSQRIGFSESAVEKVTDTFLGTIQEVLKKEEKVQLSGFGTWKVKNRKARLGRNPKTGERIEIQPRRVPVFTAGQNLKEALH